MATSFQGWLERKDATGVARKFRRIGYKARASKTKINGYFRVIYVI